MLFTRAGCVCVCACVLVDMDLYPVLVGEFLSHYSTKQNISLFSIDLSMGNKVLAFFVLFFRSCTSVCCIFHSSAHGTNIRQSIFISVSRDTCTSQVKIFIAGCMDSAQGYLTIVDTNSKTGAQMYPRKTEPELSY